MESCTTCTCCFVSSDGASCPSTAAYELWTIDGLPQVTLVCRRHLLELAPSGGFCAWPHAVHSINGYSKRTVRSVIDKRWENLRLGERAIRHPIVIAIRKRYLAGELSLSEALCSIINAMLDPTLNPQDA